MEPSIPFHTLLKYISAEDITNEKTPIFDFPLEINNVTSQLEPQNLSTETCVSNPEFMFTQTTVQQIK